MPEVREAIRSRAREADSHALEPRFHPALPFEHIYNCLRIVPTITTRPGRNGCIAATAGCNSKRIRSPATGAEGRFLKSALIVLIHTAFHAMPSSARI